MPPITFSLASLVAQMVNNPPVMQETWVRSLGQEDPPKEEMTTHSSILAWRISMDRGAWRATVHGVAKNQTRLKQLNMHADWFQQLSCCTAIPNHMNEPNISQLSNWRRQSSSFHLGTGHSLTSDEVRTWKNWTLVCYWWECNIVLSLWKLLWQFLKKLHKESLLDPAMQPLGI